MTNVKKKLVNVPPPPPHPGRATPEHPPSRVSAKVESLLIAKSLLILCAESLLKVCVKVSTKLYSLCAHTPDRRIGEYIGNIWDIWILG